jgi:hypothetical protein
VLQNKIKQAVNYSGSPIDVLLGTGGKGLDLDMGNGDEEEADDNPGTTTSGTTTSPSNVPDPLAGVA